MVSKSKQILHVLKYSLTLFFVTRIFLTCIGVYSRSYGMVMLSEYQQIRFFEYGIQWLSVWGMWDTHWYLDIAKNGYSSYPNTVIGSGLQANYGFFPLYPALIKLLSYVTQDFYLSGFLISNICLIASSVVLYKIAEI
ncbi:MAG: hypothetical protein KKD39_09140, partial [Candidatus Altiarchaeota archaeon]|nr:hypothetical protein [Candidatus Altiarchaeota archaeon]